MWPLEFFFDLQGVLVVDRTDYADRNGNFRYFSPNLTNIIRIPEQRDISENATDVPYWPAFGGNWGSSQDSGHELEGDAPECLGNITDSNSTNGTDLEDTACPSPDDNPVFWYVMQMLGVEDAVESVVECKYQNEPARLEAFESTLTHSYSNAQRHEKLKRPSDECSLGPL